MRPIFKNFLAVYLNSICFPKISSHSYPLSKKVSLSWPHFHKLLSLVRSWARREFIPKVQITKQRFSRGCPDSPAPSHTNSGPGVQNLSSQHSPAPRILQSMPKRASYITEDQYKSPSAGRSKAKKLLTRKHLHLLIRSSSKTNWIKALQSCFTNNCF